MKYYIATKLENHVSHNDLRDWLTSLGHIVTYDWTQHGPVYPLGVDVIREVAEKEIQGVIDADYVIVLWPGGRGTHAELGAAIAANKSVIFYSPVDDHHKATKETCAFYHHPNVKRFDQLESMMQYLRTL